MNELVPGDPEIGVVMLVGSMAPMNEQCDGALSHCSPIDCVEYLAEPRRKMLQAATCVLDPAMRNPNPEQVSTVNPDRVQFAPVM
jgi:hypothetical protein